MKLTLAETRYLKDSISIISELVTEARFKITKDAIELVAMDPANVAMVIFKLLGSAFAEYSVKDEISLGINLSNLKQVLKRCGASDVLSLEMGDDNKLKIEFKGKTKRTFSIPIIELDEKEQKVPELKFPLTIKTTSGVLVDSVEDADIVAESVSFMVESGKFVMEAEGDLSKARVELEAGDDTKIVTESKDTIKAKYSIEYLKKMINGSKISDKVSIQFNADYPLKLEFKEVDKILMSFILAPRVEND